MNHVKDERSLGSLFSDLTREIQRLVRAEFTLLQSEMSHKINRGAKDITFLAIGGAVLYAGLLALIAFSIIALGTAVALWLSALIVSIVVLAAGYFMLQKGLKDLKRTDFTPRETISTLKGDKEWLKKQT